MDTPPPTSPFSDLLNPVVRPQLRAWPLLLAAAMFPLGLTGAEAPVLPPPAARAVDYARDIQPLFAQHCYSCHGPQRAENAFRLDTQADAFKGGDDYGDKVLVPGRSAESVLVAAVARTHPKLKMPKKGDALAPEAVGLIRAWIDQGAPWPETASTPTAVRGAGHWGFQAPVRPPVPSPKARPASPVDAFILERLARENLALAPEADRITLLRRLHLDLTGLPPTIGEVDAFLADTSRDAYAKVVEALLASPHYGERWGRHWLDAARYADSDGYEKDMSREMWPYRDYVVGAFNRDLPYDQFLIEQLAGDQLPNATQDQIVATGFLRNSMVNMEGAIDPEQFRMEAMFDRMDALGKGMLGLTIQCAQCHNHKYDPLSQEEYYRLFAFLNNDHEARPAVHSPAQSMQIADLRRQVAALEQELQHRTPDWADRMAAWEATVRGNQPEWIVIRDLHYEGDRAQRYEFLPDGSLLACGYAPTKMTQWWRTTNDLSGLTAFRIELLTDPSLPYGGPGRAFNGTCSLSEFLVEATGPKPPEGGKGAPPKAKAKWASVTADYTQPERRLEDNFTDRSTNARLTGPVTLAIDGKDSTGWGINAGPARRNQERKAVFVAEQPLGFGSNTSWRIGLQQNLGGWNSDDHMNNNLGRYRISATRATHHLAADPLPKKVRDLIESVPRDRRTPAQQAAIFSYWRTTVPAWKEANAKIDALLDQWPDGATSMTLQAGKNRTTSLLKRGDWLKPSREVAAGTPAFLHPLPARADGSRLTLARWVTDRKSPTTARVFVNRVWQAYFGTGLVGTPEDFGVQADAPSHPALLDWLASEFMEPSVRAAGETRPAAPWSVKHLHRLLVHSATYRQSSRIPPGALEKDPYNRLLARGPRFRVEGEIVRDIALAASGLLNPRVGGRSVMPPAPEYLFLPPASYAPFPWKNEEGDQKYRRALYTFRRRSTPYPALQTFDVPNADQACVRRLRSNSPLQALVALNEPLFVECARQLARQTLAEGGPTDDQRVTYAFRRVLARPPAPDEKQELLSLLTRQRQRIGDGWLNPHEIGTGKPELAKDLPPGASPTQLAAYTVVARVLLNLDETITRE